MRPAVALALLPLAACTDLRRPATHADCECALAMPWYWQTTHELVDWANTLQVMEPVDEQYLLAERVDKATMDLPYAAEGLLDWVTADMDWEPPPGFGVSDNRVRRHTLGGWPAASRYAWSHSEPPTVHWLAVVDMPDRFYVVQAWALAGDERGLRAAMRTAGTLSRTTPVPAVTTAGYTGLAPVLGDHRGLLEAREGHRTTTASEPPWERLDVPPAPDGMSIVSYRAPDGELAAWLSDDPGDGGRQPAVLWLHPGLGGLRPAMGERGGLDDYVSLAPFLRPGLVLMAPTWRAEHHNPGEFGLFWGEVEDVLAARDHLASLPYVDPTRITLVGLTEGGTLALLAAATGDDGFRAVFAVGGVPDLGELHHKQPEAYGEAPYDTADQTEHVLRSAIWHAGAIRVPTWYIDGEFGRDIVDAERMTTSARRQGAPFESWLVPRQHSWSARQPASAWIGQQVFADADASAGVALSDADRVALGEAAWPNTGNWLDDDLTQVLRLRAAEGYMDQGQVIANAVERFAADYSEELLAVRGRALGETVVAEQRAAESTWPAVTDNDRLDDAFEVLEGRGVLARQYFEDCSTCAVAELEPLVAAHEGPVVGYTYFTWGHTERAVREGTLWLYYDGVAGHSTAEVGAMVVAELREVGLHPRWDGDPTAMIEVPIDWKRRMPR